MRAAVAEPKVGIYVAGAPPLSVTAHIDLPVLPDRDELRGFGARILGVCGSKDEFCHPNDLSLFVSSLSDQGHTEVVEGADHLFSDRIQRIAMAETVASFVDGALP